MFRMLWNTLKDGLCHLRNKSVSMKVFPLNMLEVRLLFDPGKPIRHLIYYAIFFLQKLLASFNLEAVNVEEVLAIAT